MAACSLQATSEPTPDGKSARRLAFSRLRRCLKRSSSQNALRGLALEMSVDGDVPLVTSLNDYSIYRCP